MAEGQVAHGTPVRWTALGATHEGTVTAGPDRDGYYSITTPNHAVATLKRDVFELIGDAGTDDGDELTPERRASLLGERAQQMAHRLCTDAVMQVYTLIREETQRDTGQEVERDRADDMRIEAAVRVHDAATDLRIGLTRQIAEKRKQPPPESIAEPAATAPAIPE